MRLVEAKVVPKRVRITVPYRIAGHFFDTAEIVFLILRDETGVEGYGSASPVLHLTDDDFKTTARVLNSDLLPAVLGSDVSDLDATMARARAASTESRSGLAALDIALHDVHARRLGVPLVKMLGGARRRLITSITIGIGDPEEMVDTARGHIARGFRCLKIKIGEDERSDLEALRKMRETLGPGVTIRVDANQGYRPGQAIRMVRELQSLSIELIEQPVPKEDVAGMARVTAASGVPIVADEAVRIPSHLPPLVEARAAHGANIKLMKCGGIVEARRIDAALSRAGWKALVGCFDESRASIAAAAHFAAAGATTEWIDLDGHFDLAEDPFTGGIDLVDGELILSDAPGIGVTLSGTL
jgi:L-alanine-DL-glutamate epimerase-like enolase superfamily enzyme